MKGALFVPGREKTMTCRIAGIDVHKKMLAVAVADIAGGGEFEFERLTFPPLRKGCRR